MEEKKYMDLHCHSRYSDGIFNPRELVISAKLNGLDVFALTDHDTIRGYEESKEEAERWNIALVPGAEITTKKYHLLGLGFEVQNKELLDMLEKSKRFQKDICQHRVDSLFRHGVPITIEKVENHFPESRLGKCNILMTMLRDKECREWLYEKHGNISPKELMEFYLRQEGVAGRTKELPELRTKEVIDTVHRAGGIVILAHPAKDIDNFQELDNLVEKGIDGLEIQPNFMENYHLYKEYAEKKNLLITYGSDYHGLHFDRALLGRKENILDEKLERRLGIWEKSQENFIKLSV